MLSQVAPSRFAGYYTCFEILPGGAWLVVQLVSFCDDRGRRHDGDHGRDHGRDRDHHC